MVIDCLKHINVNPFLFFLHVLHSLIHFFSLFTLRKYCVTFALSPHLSSWHQNELELLPNPPFYLTSPSYEIQNLAFAHLFLVGSVRLDIMLIHYVVNYILVLRKYNLWQMWKVDMVIVWSLANKVKTNWASAVNHHMIVNKRKVVIWVSYSHLVS